MALPPASNDAFFREVDDEVRRARFEAIGRRWGVLVAGAVVLALAAFAGVLVWQHHRDTVAGERGEAMTAAMGKLASGDRAGAVKMLEPLTGTGTKGYAPLAAMLIADAKVVGGSDGQAGAAFAKIAADDTVPQPLRDLATVRAVAIDFDRMPPADVVARLKPLMVPGSPWYGSAGEMTGIAQAKLGQTKAAGATFAAVAKDATVPSSLRQRAAQLAGDLGVAVVQPGESPAS